MSLTNEDLNNFKTKVSEINEDLLKAGQDYVIAKNKLADKASKPITKAEFLAVKEDYLKIKAKCKNTLKPTKFINNVEAIKLNLAKLSKNSDEYVAEVIKLKEAKFLLKEAKRAIADRGSTGYLTKLNNIALKLDDLKFRYREDAPLAVDGISVEIEHGEYVAIIGHNGSGKSTLSKLIIRVYEPESGIAEVFGNRVSRNNINFVRKFLGIVFQNPDNQFIGSTVKDDIAFGLENRRMDPKLMNDVIINAAKRVRMEDFLDKEPLMLSGGQKQRVAIASVLALSPDIIIFDEATSMLDPKGKREVKEIMVELKNTRQKTIFSITHDMDEILNADKVMVMNRGKLVKFGTPKKILEEKVFLRSIHLDIPFVSQVEESLHSVGIKVKHSWNMDELVDNICKK